MKNLIFLISFLTFLCSCSENSDNSNFSYKDSSIDYCSLNNSEFQSFGDASVQMLIAILTNENIDIQEAEINLQNELVAYTDSGNDVSKKYIISLYEEHFGVNKSITNNYLDVISQFQVELSDSGNDDEFINSIRCAMREVAYEKWIFGVLADVLGAPCELVAAAHIIDAGASFAGAAATSWTGVGLVAGVAGGTGHLIAAGDAIAGC